MNEPLPFKTTPVIRRYLQEMADFIKTCDEYKEIEDGAIKHLLTIKIKNKDEKYFPGQTDNKFAFYKYMESERAATMDESADLRRIELELEEQMYDLDKIGYFAENFNVKVLNAPKVLAIQRRVLAESSKSELSNVSWDKENGELIFKDKEPINW